MDEVIQKRLLSKVDRARSELADVYREKADILRNQLSFSSVGMTFKPYADELDFVSVYPFAPYQFQLVQKVFEAIRRHGVTGLHLARGERSMLDAFQSAAVQLAGEETGVLVPLHRFYPAIESFLEGVVKSTIDNAATNDKLEPFDALVLKTLFLIRYVDEIRGNVDNLVTLFVDRIDADRLALRRQIEASVQRLEKETLIGRNGEEYFFLTNEERDISREIKDVNLSSAEEAKFLGELIFEDVLKGIRKHRFPDNNKDFGINRLCDLHPHGTRTDGDLVLSVVTPLADDYALCDDGKCTLQSATEGGQLIARLDDDKTLGRELRTYLQTDKYVARKNDGTASTTTLKILRERQEENRERRKRLVLHLEQLLREARYYAAGQPLQPKGGAAATAIGEALTYLIRNSFNKLGSPHPALSQPPGRDQGRAQRHRRGRPRLLAGGGPRQQPGPGRGPESRQPDGQRQQAGHPGGLVESRFGRRPYGWPEWEVVLLIARLVRKGEISLVMDGATLAIDKVFEAVTAPSKWKRITLIKRQTVDEDQLLKGRNLAKDVFGKIAPDGEDELDAFLRERLGAWKSNLDQYKTLADTGDYPGRQEIADAQGVIVKLLAEKESFGLIGSFLERRADLLDLSDDIHELENFY
ncbi:MAG: BREX system P-loop protein BrxC, partial [Acidobacteria bacterium]|nr:BREX system P-loop protein BrxC [Acidobacteriota bacterium]